ncbi:hypothetical protein QE447_002871 [Stenotrophomonas sp. SORGH_AS282]|nr:hypothetical protein [Stenotrophomonas sp. SORGH_AS_0282]MDQ1190368.1 hypothetical protein [Stenotrophomonas sp. SORGH_AS_0282]
MRCCDRSSALKPRGARQVGACRAHPSDGCTGRQTTLFRYCAGRARPFVPRRSTSSHASPKTVGLRSAISNRIAEIRYLNPQKGVNQLGEALYAGAYLEHINFLPMGQAPPIADDGKPDIFGLNQEPTQGPGWEPPLPPRAASQLHHSGMASGVSDSPVVLLYRRFGTLKVLQEPVSVGQQDSRDVHDQVMHHGIPGEVIHLVKSEVGYDLAPIGNGM